MFLCSSILGLHISSCLLPLSQAVAIGCHHMYLCTWSMALLLTQSLDQAGLLWSLQSAWGRRASRLIQWAVVRKGFSWEPPPCSELFHACIPQVTAEHTMPAGVLCRKLLPELMPSPGHPWFHTHCRPRKPSWIPQLRRPTSAYPDCLLLPPSKSKCMAVHPQVHACWVKSGLCKVAG